MRGGQGDRPIRSDMIRIILNVGVSKDFCGEVTFELRGPGWLSGGRASQAVGITCTEVKTQRPAGCMQGMGLLSAIPYHHMLLRMEANAKEGRGKKWKVLRVPFDSLELPHQPWRGYAQTS